MLIFPRVSFRRFLLLLAGCMLVAIVPGRAGEVVLPDDVFRPYYFVDVTKAPYSIDNTGKQDVTQAIRAMIQDVWHNGQPALRLKTLYFPNGTYRLTDTIDDMAVNKQGKNQAVHRLYWLGQSRDKTLFKLDDNLPAFQDPKKPKGMIRTESIGVNGNDAYQNSFANLTLDVGAGNPGAAGIDYLASNNGEIHDVTIRAPEDSGAAGLMMVRQWPGPTFVKNLEVDGFDYGVKLAKMEYSITFEHLVLNNQRQAGFFNQDNCPFIRDLQSVNKVPAVVNTGAAGLLVLVDSKLSGGDSANAAVENAGGAFLRNVETTGYGKGLKNTASGGNADAPPGLITEYTSHPVITTKGFSSSRSTSLHLEVRETPLFEDNDFSHWYSVGNKTKPDTGMTDQADQIQAAIDEAAAQGKTTFYFIPGQYMVGHTLNFHGSIRRVLGLGAVLRTLDDGMFKKEASDLPAPAPPAPAPPIQAANTNVAAAATPAAPLPSPSSIKSDYGPPVFRVSDLQGDDIEFSQFCIVPNFTAVGKVNCYGFQQDTDKTVVLRDFESSDPCYRASDKAGDLYLETGVGNGWLFEHPGQKIWARQLDPEGNASPKVLNVGSKLWVLGLKTEKPGIQVDSSKGAETEVLGALFYPVRVPNDDPIFRVDNSRLSASYVTIDNSKTPDFPQQLVEIRGTAQNAVHPTDCYPRPCFGNGTAAIVPLIVAAPSEDAASAK